MLFHRTGLRRFYQPVVGDLTLALEAPGLAADEGPRIKPHRLGPAGRVEAGGTSQMLRSPATSCGRRSPRQKRPKVPTPANAP